MKDQKKTVIISIGVAVAAAVIVALYLFVSRGPSTEEFAARFTSALENAMKVTYVTQERISTTDQQRAMATVVSESDFTDPHNPKTKANFTMRLSKEEEKGEIIVTDPSAYYAKLHTLTESKKVSIKADQWYKVKKSSIDFVTGLIYDPASARLVNSPFGEIITGNFSDDLRKELLDFIAKNSIYEITKAREIQQEGATISVFDVAIKTDKVIELNKLLAKKLGIEYHDSAVNTADSVQWQFAVNNGTGRFVEKKGVATKKDSKLQQTMTARLSYPDFVTIKQPTDVQDSPLQQ